MGTNGWKYILYGIFNTLQKCDPPYLRLSRTFDSFLLSESSVRRVGREPIVYVVLLDIYQQTPDTSGEPHLQCHRKYNIRYFQQWFAIGRDGRENCCMWLRTMLQNEPGSKMVYMKLRLRFSMLLILELPSLIQVLYWELYLSKFAEFFPSSPSLKLEGKGNNFEVLQTLFFLLPKLFK